MHAIRTWLLVIELASVPSTYARFSCDNAYLKAESGGVQILRVAEIQKSADVRRPNIKQLLTPRLRFPLPHRVVKSRSKFLATRPSTFY